MKRTITFLTMLMVIAAVAFAGKAPVKAKEITKPVRTEQELIKAFATAKEWKGEMPKQSAEKLARKSAARKAAPRKATADELAGKYTWYTAMGDINELGEPDPATFSPMTSKITLAAGRQGRVNVTLPVFSSQAGSGTIDNNTYADYGVAVINFTLSGNSNYGRWSLREFFYYEGDEEYEAGWYTNSNLTLYSFGDGEFLFSLEDESYLVSIFTSGDYAGEMYSFLYAAGEVGPYDPGTPVVAPEGLELEEYSVTGRDYFDEEDIAGSVFIGFDGSDAYIQGLCTPLPEAYVKGTMDANGYVTFEAGQYFGNLEDLDLFLNSILGQDVILFYDANADKFIAQNEVFLADDGSTTFYGNSYRNAIFTKVVEIAAVPATPTINAMQSAGSYGNIISFTIPTVDVDGNGLTSSKLFYQIYSDVEGEISLVTFTPATHQELPEAMNTFPYGFTEDWDFYQTFIYLNNIEATWNRVGMKSIYLGGGETNESEIGWYVIKPYSIASILINLPEGAMPQLTQGETLQLSVTIAPEGAQGVINWSSSNEELATVNENGLVTAVSPNSIIHRAPGDAPSEGGTPVTITAASASNPDVKGEIELTIAPIPSAVTDITIDNAVAVKYVNAQGMVSTKPFNGINIMVTTMSDGTTKTTKVVK